MFDVASWSSKCWERKACAIRAIFRWLVPFLLLTGGAALAQIPVERKAGLEKIGHVIVVILENRSFDHLYGLFPGADGINNSSEAPAQVDQGGVEFVTLPGVVNTNVGRNRIDTRFAFGFPNAPFRMDRYVSLEETTGDLIHGFYQEQIDGGRMDRFVAASDAGSLPMGYFDGPRLPLYRLANQYVLLDHFFHAAFGGGFLNRFWLICACTPRYENAPRELVAQLGGDGHLIRDGAITPDGYAVNTIDPVSSPYDPRMTDDRQRLPLQSMPTIGHRLTDAGVSWAWHSGGFDNALAGRADPSFVYHHQPFGYFAEYADGTPGRAVHLRDERDMLAAINDRTLPEVTFYQPIGADNEHPGYANLVQGDENAALIIRAIQNSFIWDDAVIIVTYAGNGGIWDHIAPPKVDRWGPGTRVPTIIISPFAKRHFVDHTTYDTTSVLKLIETRWHLTPLGDRDARAADLTNALSLN